MRILDWVPSKKYQVVQATCDECGGECTDTNVDLHMKMSFAEKMDLHKVVCVNCWMDKYKDAHCERQGKEFDAQMAYLGAKKEVERGG